MDTDWPIVNIKNCLATQRTDNVRSKHWSASYRVIKDWSWGEDTSNHIKIKEAIKVKIEVKQLGTKIVQ